MIMPTGEIVRSYKQALTPWEQITVLADLNQVSRRDIITLLLSEGINPFENKPGKLGVLLSAEEADMLFEILSMALERLKKREKQFAPDVYALNAKLMNSVIGKLIKVK